MRARRSLRGAALVALAPFTRDTNRQFDAAVLARMRDGALLVNAGRGRVVDTAALVAELESGRPRAVLDVVDPERSRMTIPNGTSR